VAGFAVGEHHDAELAYGALVMRWRCAAASARVIMHTDCGSEYTAGLFRSAASGSGIRQSMCRRLGAG